MCDTALAATLTGADIATIAPLEQDAGKPKLIITFPTVDISACSLESKKFSDAIRVRTSIGRSWTY